MAAEPARETLYVPDRFEGLRGVTTGALRSIVAPVTDTLGEIDRISTQMKASRRGSLLLLRGDTGAGKSTFLDTIGLFRNGVTTERISRLEEIDKALADLGPSTGFRVVVLEGREALGKYSVSGVEADLHAVNSFVRSPDGLETLVVWPINRDDLLGQVLELGMEIGGQALFGSADPRTRFTGPPKSEFVSIAESTVSALNEGASLAALGISEEHAVRMVGQAGTIGTYLGMVRDALLENQRRLLELLPAEKFRMWTVVVAGTETEGDVAALTRGGFAYVDIDRLMTSTGANVVEDLKQKPDQLGILGSQLDAKIINLDMLTILAVARTYGDDKLHEAMRVESMSVKHDRQARARLAASELGLLMTGESLGTKKRGKKPGDNTKAAFSGLASIARTNDALLNRAVGRALLDLGYISSFETEHPLGTNYAVRSDLYVVRDGEPIRLEVMWRSKAGRADIANYVLGKLALYARAIGLFD